MYEIYRIAVAQISGAGKIGTEQSRNKLATNRNGSMANETIACVSGSTKPHAGTHKDPY
jgi:hypothetical protein